MVRELYLVGRCEELPQPIPSWSFQSCKCKTPDTSAKNSVQIQCRLASCTNNCIWCNSVSLCSMALDDVKHGVFQYTTLICKALYLERLLYDSLVLNWCSVKSKVVRGLKKARGTCVLPIGTSSSFTTASTTCSSTTTTTAEHPEHRCKRRAPLITFFI